MDLTKFDLSKINLQVGVYDFVAFGFVFLLFALLVALSIAFKGKIRIFSIIFATMLFFAMPILSKLIVNDVINRVAVEISEAKKLVYTDTFFISGKLTNKGRRAINECVINLYTTNFYPFQKPNYTEKLENLALMQGKSVDLNQMISDFNPEETHKKIKVICK